LQIPCTFFYGTSLLSKNLQLRFRKKQEASRGEKIFQKSVFFVKFLKKFEKAKNNKEKPLDNGVRFMI